MLFTIMIALVPPALSFFFFNDTATTEIYTLSLHDALPIFVCHGAGRSKNTIPVVQTVRVLATKYDVFTFDFRGHLESGGIFRTKIPPLSRSEEHTSELQSHSDLVCRLLLEKKETMP